MAKEIERKFLVKNTDYKSLSINRFCICQGYLSRKVESTVRVRIKDERAFLTVKGRTMGMSRSEWEYEIPVDEARAMLQECAEGTVLSKTRYIVPFEGLTWEIDEFHAAHEGLVLAEVELESEEAPVMLPSFVGEEVTGDSRYYNSNL